MPEICRFYGIIVFMNYNDHSPPHFHAWYGEFKATINILDGIVKGEMPKRALNLIFEWLDNNKEDLLNDWQLAKEGKSLVHINPLP